MDIQSNPELLSQWGVIVGFALPLLLSVILQSHWRTEIKAWVSFGAVLIASAVTAYFEGKFQSGNWLGTFFTVLVATITSFKALWQPTGMAQSIEEKTDIGAD